MTKHIFYLLVFLVSGHCLFAQINFVNQADILGVGIDTGNSYLGNGISFCDYNNDGWDDITLGTEEGQSIKFYKNVNGSFIEDIIDLPVNTAEQKQIIWVDYNNDGQKDLFVASNSNSSKLYKNVGGMIFQDVTAAAGLPNTNIDTYGASWGDYNNDSYLDVF